MHGLASMHQFFLPNNLHAYRHGLFHKVAHRQVHGCVLYGGGLCAQHTGH